MYRDFWVKILLGGGRRMDPNGGGQAGRLGAFPFEPLRVGEEGGLQGFGAFLAHRCGLSEVDGGRGHEADARVAMGLVDQGRTAGDGGGHPRCTRSDPGNQADTSAS